MTAFLLVLALVLGATPSAPAAAPDPAAQESGGVYDLLSAEYELAVVEWRAAQEAADPEARKELRANHPAKTYWPRFQELADGGEGRALLWMLEHMRPAGVSLRERAKLELPIFERLVADCREEPWFGQALEALDKRAGRDDSGRLVALLEVCAMKTKARENRAQAAFLLARRWLGSDEPARDARAKELLALLESDYADTEWAGAASGLLAGERLKPGAIAPDFEAQTIEGHAFKLSDYRGKVVLVDFYGFW